MKTRTKRKQKKALSTSLGSNNLLTEGEREIILLHMHGKNRKDIARILKVQVSTIDAHTKSIHHKTGTHDVTAVIKYGHDHHLDTQ